MEKNYFSKNDIITYGRYNILTELWLPKILPERIIVDYLIAPILEILNKKGYKTIASCSGHWDRTSCKSYICFSEDYGFKKIPSMFTFRHIYNDYIIEHRIYRRSDINITIFEITKSLNDLYEWALSLPNYEKII